MSATFVFLFLLNLPSAKIKSSFILIFPFSGVINPKIHFNKTDFPEPDLPIITEDVPLLIFKFNPFKTKLSLNFLCKFSKRKSNCKFYTQT